MLFNSIEFFIFLPLVFVCYWLLLKNNIKYQNFFLLIASYVFYAWWDWRFLSLILFSSIVDYLIGIKIFENKDREKSKKYWLWLSMTINLSILGFFKYFNFFINSFIDAFNSLGISFNHYSLNIILPVGISFYTFQTMSYSLDISKNKIKPSKDFIAFATFVAFFPQLVAGPIERASNLLPQFSRKRKFEYKIAVDGASQILWGLFKKIVIADNCAPYVNEVFGNYSSQPTLTLILGTVVFAFQIYADFSGYTDIAIGVAKLFGFDFKRNFNYPYFATNISDFWKRWHISLSSWLNDYVFTPLAINFRHYKKRGIFTAVFITFLVSGLWHGAGWNFIIWGGLHGLFYLPIIFSKKRFTSISTSKNIKKSTTKLSDLPKILSTFILVCITYIFFRSETLTDAFLFIKYIFNNNADGQSASIETSILLFILLLVIIEWFQRDKQYGLQIQDLKINRVFKWSVYYLIIFFIFWFGAEKQDFIYFQF